MQANTMQLKLQVGRKSTTSGTDSNYNTDSDVDSKDRKETQSQTQTKQQQEEKEEETKDSNHDQQQAYIESKESGILHLVCKLLVLVIASTVFTLLFMSVMVVRITSDELSHWPQTLQSVSFAIDIFVSMFAIYAQFGVGERLYEIICWKCHIPIFYACVNRLTVAK